MPKHRALAALLLATVAASTAGAQGCYEFSGSGVTLQITISSFTLQNGPTFSNGTGYITSDQFLGSNSFTIGGATQTSQTTASKPGAVNFNYQPGNGAVTAFTIAVPANNTPLSTDTWSAVLGGLGDVIPSGVLPTPQNFPPISAWSLPENNILVTGGPNSGMYPITSIGPCSSPGGPGGSGGGGGSGTPTINGVISASSYGGFAAIAPGTFAEIYGTDLAPDKRSWGASDFNGNDAPTSLDNVSVTIGGQSAFVEYISADQVNVQVPSNVPIGGSVQVIVSNGAAMSAPFNVTVKATEPGLLAPASFQIGGNQYVVAQLPGGTYVLPTGSIAGVKSRPAHPGEEIVIYGIGFGSVTPQIPAGMIVTGQNNLALPIQIMFGQTPAELKYYGLAPGFVGLYQFNVVVPAVPDNDLVPLTLNLGGVAGTQTLFTAVHQ